MCLKSVDAKNKTEEFKKSIPSKGLKVYKVVCRRYKGYYPLYMHIYTPFSLDGGKADTARMIEATLNDRYQAGFHFWLNKKDAEKHKKFLDEGDIHNNVELIECMVKKSWITAVGMNEIPTETSKIIIGKTIIAKKAIFPKYK